MFVSSLARRRALLFSALLLAALVVLTGCEEPAPSAPSAPANLTITPRNEEVFLSWDEVSGAASYHVYRGEMLIEVDPPLTATTYTDSDLTNGTEYSYTVRAVGGNGVESGGSNVVMATPAVPPASPSSLGVVAIIGSVELTWTVVNGAESYRVYRDGTLLAMNITANAAPRYTDNTVINGTEYRYTVRAVGSTGVEGGDSPEMRATPPATVDFSTLANAGNGSPSGLWSDGTTMWVGDIDGTIYAYRISDESRDPAKDFVIDSTNSNIGGIWANATTMWVLDPATGTIFAYNRSNNSRDASQDFNGLTGDGVNFATGIWSDGNTMWVMSALNDTIFAYNLSSKERDSAKDIVAATLRGAGNDRPFGITGRDGTMWVSDDTDDKLYAYNLNDRTYNSAQDFDTLAAAGNNTPVSMWASNDTMWVADDGGDRIYAYNLSSKALIQ